jgi:hypothetical protein
VKKNLWWLMVVIVFVVGLLVSNMLVQAKENITEIQWEYKTVSEKFKKTIKLQLKQDLSMLNKHGKDGWELCGVNNTIYYFKKEIKK